MTKIEFLRNTIANLENKLDQANTDKARLVEELKNMKHQLGIVEHYELCNKNVGGGCSCGLNTSIKRNDSLLAEMEGKA